jgi:hypothetical protein
LLLPLLLLLQYGHYDLTPEYKSYNEYSDPSYDGYGEVRASCKEEGRVLHGACRRGVANH